MLDLHIEQVGENNNKSLIFLHGFMGCSQDFIELAQELKDEFNCFLVDLPGHGKSQDKIDQFENLSDFLIKLNNWCKTLPSPHLFGYSMGGRLAFGLSTFDYSPFIKIVIESADPGIQDTKLKEKRLAYDRQLFSRVTDQENFKRFLDEWYKQPLFHNFNQLDSYNDIIKKKIENQDYKILQKAINLLSVGNQDNYWPQLKSPKFASLYISGEHDKKYCEIADKLSLIGWSTAKIKNGGHNTHRTNQSEFKEIFKKFISS